MPEIIQANSFSSATLTAPGTYVVVEPPPPVAVGPSTNVGGVVGTASWGPLNTPVLMGDYNEAVAAFGPVNSAAVSGGPSGGADPYDLATDLKYAFSQAQGSGASIGLWGVRVSDGTDVKATVNLEDTAGTPAVGGALNALYTGTMGNQVKISLYAGSKANTTSVKLQSFNTGQVELFPNLSSPGDGTFWANLANALSNGITAVRGPSQIARFVSGGSSTAAPALGTFTLAGGTDGRTTVTSAQLTGSNSTYPYTGAYALQKLSPAVSLFWIVGLTDNTVYAAMLTLASAMAAAFPITFTSGTDTASVVTDLQGYGVSDYHIFPIKDYLYVFDDVNNAVRLIAPMPVQMARILTLSVAESPLNKPVYSVIGTERNNPLSGVNQPYSDAEISQLQENGITAIANPCPGGSYFGFQTGVNASSNYVESPVEFTRVTNYLTGWIASISGKFLGKNQTSAKGDPLRAQVRAAYNSGIQVLVEGGVVAAGTIQCDSSNNKAATVAAHQMYAYFKFTYLSSVWYFVAQMSGGTTVVTSGSTLNSALQALPS